MVAAKLAKLREGRQSKETPSNDGVSKTDAAKQLKEARNRKIFDMWLACYSNDEIGTEFDMTPQAVGQVLKESADLPKLSKPDQSSAEHATDFTTGPLDRKALHQQNERVAASQTRSLASR